MTFSKQFIEIMDAIGDKIGIAIDWTSDNVTPYLQDLLVRFVKYETLTNTVWIVLTLIIIIGCAMCIRKGFKSDVDTGASVSFVLLLPIFISAIMLVNCTLKIIEVNTIPEKTIMRYVKDIDL